MNNVILEPSTSQESIPSSEKVVVEPSSPSGVPHKRSAMLINKFMKDVQRAFEERIPDKTEDGSQSNTISSDNEAAIKRKFSRCYLNAASCFI